MLSIVVPVYNEAESLRAFYLELIKFVPKLSKEHELIFVDDGSSDSSLSILKELEKGNKNFRVFSLRRHQGKAEALTLGFQKARGDYIITLDADLQDRPEEMGKLLKKLKEGWDLVSGWRKNRKDSFAKLISSKLFNFLASFFWGVKINDLNSGIKAYTKEAAKSLNLYGGMHRFIPVLLADQGFRVTEIPVIHKKREFGSSKYKATKVFTELPDIFTMLFLSKYSERPLHFFFFAGSFILVAGLLVLGYLSMLHFQGHPIGRRPLLFFGMLLILSGLQLIFTGFLADLLLHISSRNGNKNKILLKFESDK